MAISPTDIQILFTNYDIAYFLNLIFWSEHFISIQHRILTTFNINKKNQFEILYHFNGDNLKFKMATIVFLLTYSDFVWPKIFLCVHAFLKCAVWNFAVKFTVFQQQKTVVDLKCGIHVFDLWTICWYYLFILLFTTNTKYTETLQKLLMTL